MRDNRIRKRSARPAPSALDSLARRLDTAPAWEDLRLPRELVAKLRRLCGEVQGDRGASRQVRRPAAPSVLVFVGPTGTGKTLAAGCFARELGRDLYRVDLSTVFSKYIGETEKNLARLFDAAEDAEAVLFFDEADALFAKRTETRDAHDRYRDAAVEYTLQRISAFRGPLILSLARAKVADAALAALRTDFVVLAFPPADDEEE